MKLKDLCNCQVDTEVLDEVLRLRGCMGGSSTSAASAFRTCDLEHPRQSHLECQSLVGLSSLFVDLVSLHPAEKTFFPRPTPAVPGSPETLQPSPHGVPV